MSHLELESFNMINQQADLTEKLLLVDDDKASLMVAESTLTNRGFEIFTANNGIEALALIEKIAFSAVILDARMPKMDGFETCERVRHNFDHRNLPIIIATGINDAESIDRAFDSGATDYVAKPINFQLLSNRLAVMLSENKKRDDQSSRPDVIIRTLRKTNDFVLRVDQHGQLQLSDKDLKVPFALKQTVAADPTIEYLLNKSDQCDKHLFDNLKNQQAGYASPSFIVTQSESSPIFRYKMQLFKLAKNDYCATIIDQTEQLTSELKIHNMLNYDAVTLLPNTNSIKDYLNNLDKQMAIDFTQFGIARISVQALKSHQQTLGDNLTRQLLINLKLRVKQLLKSEFKISFFARDGYDNFIIAVEQCEQTDFIRSLEKLFNIISMPFTTNQEPVSLKVDIGACHGLSTEHNAKQIFNQTLTALVKSNSQTRTVGFYDHQLKESIAQQEKMKKLLRRDLARESLEVYFQAKFATRSLSLIGMEALLRWNSDELGFVSPGQFIPLAEQCGLMDELSQMVIKKTLSQLALWKTAGQSLVPVSINLDGDNLNHTPLINELIKQMEKQDISPEYIEVEVTESVMVEANSNAMKNLQRLKNAGIKVAMDDFGTGYSSFSYLRQLPLDTLKIDMSFVKNIESDNKARAIAKAIISIGHELGLHVIAEGVETEEQLSRLTQMGCDSIQGFLTGKPVNAEQFGEYFDGFRLNQ